MRQPSETPAKKKPYQSPKLFVYGNLTQMTQTTGLVGKADGRRFGRNTRTG